LSNGIFELKNKKYSNAKISFGNGLDVLKYFESSKLEKDEIVFKEYSTIVCMLLTRRAEANLNLNFKKEAMKDLKTVCDVNPNIKALLML